MGGGLSTGQETADQTANTAAGRRADLQGVAYFRYAL